jgi:hypothetical protein
MTQHSIEVEHSLLSRYCKKKLYCSYKKIRIIPGKIPTEQIQLEFIQLMEQLYSCVSADAKELLLYLDPMHQIHNNENDYASQRQGSKAPKKYLLIR